MCQDVKRFTVYSPKMYVIWRFSSVTLQFPPFFFCFSFSKRFIPSFSFFFLLDLPHLPVYIILHKIYSCFKVLDYSNNYITFIYFYLCLTLLLLERSKGRLRSTSCILSSPTRRTTKSLKHIRILLTHNLGSFIQGCGYELRVDLILGEKTRPGSDPKLPESEIYKIFLVTVLNNLNLY